MFSANRWEAMKDFQEKLQKGYNIVCDRYWYSGVAYSHAKGLDLDWCIEADKGLRQPDLILFLRADPHILAQRNGYGNERFEKVDFQLKVRDAFEKIMKKVNQEKLKIIDVDSLSLEEVKMETESMV